MFRPNREFQAGLNQKEARRQREKNSLSLRRKDREIKLQKKRSKILNNNLKKEKDKLLEDLPRFVSGCFTQHKATIFECTQKIRKLLSFSNNVPIKQVIDSGVIPRLLQFLRWNDCHDLQFEAMWVLTNIASSDKPEYTAKIVRDGGIMPFIDILIAPSYKLQEQAVWALGNIAGDCVELRDMMLKNNVLTNILTLCKSRFNEKYCDKTDNERISGKSQYLSLLKNVSWSLSNFCRYGGHTNNDLLMLLRCLYNLFKHNDAFNEDAMNINDIDSFGGNIGWSFCYLTNNTDFPDTDNTQILLMEIMNKNGITEELIKLLDSNNMYTIHPILRSIGNILTGNHKYTTKCIQYGLLKYLYKLLIMFMNNNSDKLKEICWAISNITAGTEEQIICVIQHKFFPILIDIVKNSRRLIASEALWAISNATSTSNIKIIQHLVDNGLIEALCIFFKNRFNLNTYNKSNDNLLMVSLECIENILKFDNIQNNHQYSIQFETFDGLNFLEYLQSDDKISQSIYDKVVQIIQNHFGEDDNNHNVQFQF